MLVVLAVIIVAAVAAAVLGIGGLGRGTGVPAALLIGAAALAFLVLLAVLAFGLQGFGSSSDDDAAPARSVPRPVPRAGPTPATTPPESRIEPSARDLPVLGVAASDPVQFAPHSVAGVLQPESVVRVRATGFGSFEAGTVEQCVTELGRRTSCVPGLPVQFDENGNAEFQFQLRAFAPGDCRTGQPTCMLRVRGMTSRRQGTVHTVFVDGPPQGRITVEPRRGLADGDVVRVSVSGFPANVSATAVLCAPPSGYDVRRCGLAGREATFTVGTDGAGHTDLAVRAGPLGTERAPCGPRATCAVSVVTEHGFVAAPVVPIRFSLGPGASYEPRRLAVGLSLAALLVALALLLVRTTDWTKPTEAATPQVDAADLETGLSLDDLFGTDEELDAADPVEL